MSSVRLGRVGAGVACEVFDGSDSVCCCVGGRHPGAIVCEIESWDFWLFVHCVDVVLCVGVVCRVSGLCRWRFLREVMVIV